MKEDGGIETGSPYHGVLKAVSVFALTIVDSVSIIVAKQGVVEEDAGQVIEIQHDLLCGPSINT